MARSKVKGRKKPKKQNAGFDVEALGFLLVSGGIFLGGLLLPSLPTGELGVAGRSLLVGRLGLGAYLLPIPFLSLGTVFLLGRVPRGWARLLGGYALAAVGLWCLLLLARPDLSGAWGLGVKRVLTGAAGYLAYLPALFIFSLGFDLLLGLAPVSSSRAFTQRAASGCRAALRALQNAYRGLKDRAAFSADVALAKRELARLDGELAALTKLYPGSAEVGNWRKTLRAALKKLKKPTSEGLEDASLSAASWDSAVMDFARARAAEFKTLLAHEGIPEFEGWVKGLRALLDDAIEPGCKTAKPLDTVRHALALDLTGLAERYHRLTRERDLAEAALKSMSPSQLVDAIAAHQTRLKAYAGVQEDVLALEAEADLLEPWRELVAKLGRLLNEFPDSMMLNDVDEMLFKAFKKQGRKVLPELAEWQKPLDEAELAARRGVPQKLFSPDAQWAQGEDFDQDFEQNFERPSYDPAAVDQAAYDTGAFDEALALEPEPIPEVPFENTGSRSAESLSDMLQNEAETETDEVPAAGGIPIQLPGLELLEPLEAQAEDPAIVAQEVQARVRKIDETLRNFRLEGRVVSSVRGPSVTRFEVEPGVGEKISKFANLSDDLALAMAVGSVRIEAPIPGKSVIGLEVPNANRDLIKFREGIKSGPYRRAKARLPMLLGKSIDGELVVGDLAKMPHLLIAGSTGSGKSVAVNTLIGSLLYKFLPTELRFLMIDPKMVELTPFDGIPHLLQPVVTNPNDAAGVLLGAVAHMERRYKMMSKIGAKTLDQYNAKARNLDLPEMPFIVIVIDELADLMITSPKEVESAIMRLAQMARATGMHLVLATQRPSVDILTSLIKVNVPARMAFAVSSGHDSRTILDSMGAERLIGQGDMLFYQPGLVKPARLQGPFITESEIADVSSFLRRQYFDDDFVEAYGSDFAPPSLNDSDASGLVDWNDDKLREAAELIVNEGQASVSRLQRRLQVGHARAGKLMDSLEALAVVGPHNGSKPRDVLVELHELPNIFGS